MKHSQCTHVGRWMPAAVTLFFALFAQPAWAYLDPGTGSMIISAIVGLVATAGLAIKTYWYKIKAFMRKDTAEPLTGDDAPIDSAVESERPADH